MAYTLNSVFRMQGRCCSVRYVNDSRKDAGEDGNAAVGRDKVSVKRRKLAGDARERGEKCRQNQPAKRHFQHPRLVRRATGPSRHYRGNAAEASSANAFLTKAVRAVQGAGIGKSKRKSPIRAAFMLLGSLDRQERRRQTGKVSPYQTRGVLEASSHRPRVRRERNGCY